MKRSFMALLCALMCLFAFSTGLCAADVTSGTSGDVNWSYSAETKTLSFSLPDGQATGKMADYKETPDIYRASWTRASYVGDIQKVEIADGITSIGNYAFLNCSGLKEIKVPNSVTSIGTYVFKNCSSLESFTIPTGLTQIPNGLFYNCVSLKSCEIPSQITSIGVGSFQLCSGLTSMTVPNTVTSVGQSAFAGCANLKSIQFSDTVTSLANSVFSGCAKLESFTISDKVTSIEQKAFNDCAALKKMDIPDSVETIKNYAFAGCSGLTSLKLPSGLETIPGYMIDGCTSLSSLELPATITKINNSAFQNSGLTTIKLPDDMTSIPDSIFLNCEKLEKITIPSGVTEIKGNAFENCKSLTSIKIPSSVKKISMSVFKGCEKLSDVGEIPENVTLSAGVFRNCKSLTSVKLPASAKINRLLFMGCTALKEVTFSYNANGANMFSGCTSLEKVTFLEGSTGFGNNTFNSYSDKNGTFEACKALKEVVVPASLTDWGTNPFDLETLKNIKFTGAGADNFPVINNVRYTRDKTTLLVVYPDFSGEFEVPATVTAINNNAFADCTKLTKVTFAEGSTLESIGSNVFNGCTALAEIKLPSTLKDIGNTAFAECSSLAAISLPEGLETIGSEAFLNCAKLKELKVPSTVTSFGYRAVNGTDVEELVIPAGVTKLVEQHFYGNEKIKRIVLKGGVKELPGRAFAGCPNIESVTLPATITTIRANSLFNVPMVYFEGTVAQWSTAVSTAEIGYRYTGTAICNYKEPTTEKGKMEVAEYPENVVCTNAEDMKNTTMTLKLKYPDGVAPQEGDTIWADWYYTTQTPDGLKNLSACPASKFDSKNLTSTLTLSHQGTEGKVGAWYYICVVFKTDAQGNTTMMTTKPVSAVLKDENFTLAGSGSESDPFLIESYDHLCAIANSNDGFDSTYFKVTKNIELKEDWTPIPFFEGTLDGDHHTLTFAKGSKGLFVKSSGTLKNLNLKGEYITTPALAQEASGTINNCKLLSGSATSQSGLVSLSGGIKISNCEVESGVKIGWDADKKASTERSDGIGSIIGLGAFTVTNCKSAATVYGVHNVGGIGGSNGYSMRGVSIRNCTFTGEIIATGDFIGGIMGSGYDCHTAPNTKATNVENCYVNAKITGRQAVGGIFGGEEGLDQCWDNGIGYVRNNLFYGTITLDNTAKLSVGAGCPSIVAADNFAGSHGGIIGFMRSLNKYTIVENNFYYETGGCNKAIGAVEHIDTSAKAKMGMGEDGIYYYDTSRDSFYDIKEFVDREDKYTEDWQFMSVCVEDLNRTDDPMGKDAAKLGRSCTVEEMKDGTVLKLLNSGASSLKNWIQPEGAVCPVLSDKPIVTELKLSGEYKTEYFIGEKLDMTGAVFTATWSDGKTAEVSLDEITFSGFDSSKRAVQTVTAACGNAKVTFEVKIVKNTAVTFEVSFTLLGDAKHGDLEEGDDGHTLAHENLTTWLEKKTYTVAENATVWDLLQQVSKENGNVIFHTKSGNNNYVSYVTFNGETLGEFDNGTNSGWMYILNGRHPLLGVREQFLEPGDEIVWHYTDNYVIEDPADDARVAVMETIDLIDAIGEVTKDSRKAIEAARAAYDALDKDSKAKVTNYEVLTAAEAAYSALPKEEPKEDVEIIDSSLLPFKDLTDNWYKQAVAYVYSYKLMNGTSATAFEPQTTLNRAMMATILYRIEGEPAVTAKNPFGDVKNDIDGKWYYNAVLWASQNGIVKGYEDDTFRPVREITREEMAVMMYRYAEYKGMDMTATADFAKFSDGATVNEWAKPAMSWAVGVNLITGHDNGTLEPQGTATRAQAATVLMRFNELMK